MKSRKVFGLLLAVCLICTQIASAVLAGTAPAVLTGQNDMKTGQEAAAAGTMGETVAETEATPSNAVKPDILLETVAEDGMKITLKADADAFEYDGELSLEAAVVSEKTAEKAAEELEGRTGSDNIARRVTYDIRVMQDGKELQPVAGKKVRVEFTMSDIPSGADAVSVYHHVKAEGKAGTDGRTDETDEIDEIDEINEINETEETDELDVIEKIETIVENVPVNTDKKESTDVSEEDITETEADQVADQKAGKEETVGGETESFSLYTVDFTYDEKTVSLPGDTDHNRLADLLSEIGITEAIKDAKACRDADCKEPAADGIVADAEGNVLFQVYEEGGEWYADAINPFSTEHGLLVITDNAEYNIKVTDDAAANGFRYNVKYIDENGALQNCAKATALDNTMKGEWPAGWYVAVGAVTMENASVTVSGEVHLILADGCNLIVAAKKSKAGIRVNGSSNSLTIYGQSAGTGVLNASGRNTCAGIGGERDEAGENITINGGTVTATGKAGAGIGGGMNGEGKNITINGGSVTAKGEDGGDYNYGGAGIGGGEYGEGKNITINGGTVTATSVAFGAGIGGGRGKNGTDIIINGGIVTANGGKNGAGIGGGGDGNGGGEGNNITINGGTVTATGGNYGAGIGGGYTQKGNNIRIYGGRVTATAGNDATGIGGGASYGGGSATACYYIYASKAVVVKAGSSYPPTSEILPDHDIDKYLGHLLYGNRYVTAVLAPTVVTLDPNGGTAGTKTEVQVSLGSDMPALSASELPAPSAAGNVFTGFFDAKTGGNMYYRPDGNSARRWDKSGESATLYAHWAAPTDIGGAAIDAISSQTYTGSAITPEVTVRYGGSVLDPDKDYTVSYSNNTNAGEATVTVSGKGIYTGSKEARFTIDARSIADAQISGIPASLTYNGQEQKPVPVVKLDGKGLTGGDDYTPAYTNNKDAGDASVTVTGKGNYTGAVSTSFKITKANLTLTSDSATKVYDRTPLTSKHVTSEGFVAGEGAAYDVTGSQTEVGSSKNTFTYTMNSGTKESNYEIKKVEGDLIVTKAPEYLVRFDVQGHGTTPAAVTVMKGDKVTKPADPAATGYVFEGWYKEKGCTTAWNFASDTVSADITLYAKWTDKMFTVTYHRQGHGTAPAPQTVREGDKPAKPADPAETGYVFGGWYRESECTTKWNFDVDTVTKNTDLYAKWTDRMYTVSFDVQGHGTAPGKQTVREGDKPEKPANPTATGYVFEGWYKEKGCITEWNFAVDTVSTDTTLYAKWTDKMFTVTYITQGHGTAPAPMQVREGSLIEKPGDPSEKGYTFAGWYREKECSVQWKFDSDKVTGNTVLYAKWTEKTYTVSFDANGHGTPPGPQTVREGDKLTKPADPVYSGEDVKFAGWFKDAACKESWNFSVDTVTKDMTLYAYWVGIDYLVIFANSKYKDYDGTALSDPGYTCSGLKKEHTATVTVEGSITDAGTAENKVTKVIVKNGETDVTKDYNIVTIPGVLTVEKKKLTVTGVAVKDKLYDGTNDAEIDNPGTVTGIVGTDDVTVSRTAVFLSKNVGADISVFVEYQIGGEQADNYEKPDSKQLKASINRRTVVMTSASAQKVYDGKPLTAAEVSVSDGGFVRGEGAQYQVSGSQTQVGSSNNTFTYQLDPGTETGNYTIQKEEGTLTVNKKKLTATGMTVKDKLYDGTSDAEIDDPGTITGIAGTDDGKITVSRTAVFLSKNAGAGIGVLVEYQIGGERAGNYEKPDNTELKAAISRRTVVMTSASAQKVYDGKPLTAAEVSVSGDGFVHGEGADYQVTGSQAVVGSSKNTFTYQLNTGTNPDNYTIQKEEGTLTVKAAPYRDEGEGNDTPYTTETGTGTWDRPATGTWTLYADGSWGFGNRGIPKFSSTWGYILHKGSRLSDWYYFGADGKILTGFRTIGGKIYYFREVKDSREGAMESGFQTIGGKIYYFDPQRNSEGGAMATGRRTINGIEYNFGTDGALVTGGTYF